MKILVSLRHLHISYTVQVPDEIGCLTSLRTLQIFEVGTNRRWGIGQLGCLSELGGKLAISSLQNVRNKEEAQGTKMWEKKKLQKLECQCKSGRNGSRNDEEVLEGLEPHSNLKSLTIWNYNAENNPSWLVRKSVSGPSANSFQPIINLVELNLFYCENLKNLPTLGQNPNLRFLRIRDLYNVRCIGNEFYMNNNSCDSGDEKKPITLFPASEKFSLVDLKEVKEWLDIEPGVPTFPSLKKLEIVGCDKLSSVPVMSRLSSLEILTIAFCGGLSLIGDGLFPSSLKNLAIQECRKLSSIPSVEGGISFLQELRVKGCDELSKIEEGQIASTCLRDVYIWKCPKLTSIPSIDGCCSFLSLSLDGCEGLTSLPSGLGTCTSLRDLYISNCTNLKSIPEDVCQLQSLLNLYIRYCENLKSIPEGSLGCLTRLKTLELGPFSEELEEFPGLGSIHHLHSSLENLILVGWEKLSSLPDQLQQLTAPDELWIWNFSGVKALPEWLGNLSSLRSLYICDCENLGHLPYKEAMQRLSILKQLSIVGCPRLKGNFAEQSKISHIPNICGDIFGV
ncbi:putative disease resistance RPP13-like protein 1 [Durio zibethinus]|uniref:Disease resistance RPP13-like protein 1 n=1 Tax=Durio zibethinus TaxID=66656 RepID=A0A6P5X4B2_DURZI|nr:putative disease resistance RPP13-like protein 1 [Durio zibethinus]